MRWDEDRGRGGRIACAIILVILVLFLLGVLYLRFFANDSVKVIPNTPVESPAATIAAEPAVEPTEEVTAPTETPAEETPAVEEPAAEEPEETPAETAETAEETAEPVEENAETSEDKPEAAEDTKAAESAEDTKSAEPAEFRPIHYDAKSYQLVTDLVFAYKKQVSNLDAVIAADVAALKEHDERLGEAWGGIMDYWVYANKEMEIQKEKLPDDLPDDDSLCIVILGFQLNPDGTMAKEMLGRCELGLAAAKQYPKAYILLTGGGTAPRKVELTEAGVMANWFKEQGITEERLILEDKSLTTDQNASLSMEILTKEYPQIKHLVIVSSDYHLPLSCLLFTAASLMRGAEYGQAPFDVVSNLGYPDTGLPEYTEPNGQGQYLWALTHPGT